ncbi:hypothetical protein ACW2Q0_28455 [Nocardia sp. R16R-3T]
MTAPHQTVRAMIIADARNAGWNVFSDSMNCVQLTHGFAVLSILWTGDGEVFAATLSGDGDMAPEGLGLIPVADPVVSQAILLGWIKGTEYHHPQVRDISNAAEAIAELDFARNRVW